jgi:hypothetical protein
MSDPRRGPEKPRSNRTAVIIGAAVFAAFVIYMLAYGFGGFFTQDAQERAQEAPSTEQPVDDFAADEPAGQPAEEDAVDDPQQLETEPSPPQPETEQQQEGLAD